MKFSERWLREWADPPVSTEELAGQLTMAGLEVDAVAPVAPPLRGVVVAKVLSVDAHPAADRLRVCSVDVGESAPLSIVCGAPDVRAGMLAPAARVGASLPDEKIVEQVKVRGVESQGMLCSAAELGLGEGEEGLMSLPLGAVPGTDLNEYLELDDFSIELGLTPNRGDCLGIEGIAREVGVLNRVEVTGPSCDPVAATIDDRFAVEIAAPVACPRYLGRVIRGVDPAVETPWWMRERLRRSGLRSIGPVVDVTNYVLLELGQPMHAFDLDRLEGGITVRYAEEGEQITLLDGQQLVLSSDALVIADRRRAVALAGIMGGQGSAVGGQTGALFLECAFFTPGAIAGKARSYGLHTDSSHRFERGVDPELPVLAMERATQLLLDIVGGQPGPVVEATVKEHFPVHAPVRLRADRLRRVLGCEIAPDEVVDILTCLGMSVHADGPEAWLVTAPPFRFDIAIEADLIEEIARIHGYDHLPETRPSARLTIGRVDAGGERVRQARDLLADRGFQEAITYSFVDARTQHLFDPESSPRTLANPLSADNAVMRTNLWPGLVQACLHNLYRQQPRVRLFEHGTRFLVQDDAVNEEGALAAVATGPAYPQQWGLTDRPVDFFDVKADVEAVLAVLGGRRPYLFDARRHPALHPGQCACIKEEGGDEIGWLGALHPEVARELGIEQDVVVFELVLSRIRPPEVPVFHELSKYPAIRRDLAVMVDDSVTAAAVSRCVRDVAGRLLRDLELFDVYRGKGIDSGKKSLGLGLTLQDFSRTLRDDEIDALITTILQELNKKFGATLRE